MKKDKRKEKGITLIALVITIIVLLILSGVTISALSGENGIITNAVKAKKMTLLSQYKEEYEMFLTDQVLKDRNFKNESLVAGETNLIYNTQKQGEIGNIYNVIPSLKNNDFSKKLEIIKGELLLNSNDKKEVDMALSLGIKVNPYDIVNGELLSSKGNLLLMDETGTLTIPDSVEKIGDGAFADLAGLKTIIIPGTVKIIGRNAFRNNSTLEKVIIENGVQKIDVRAFSHCSNLLQIIIPDSVTKLAAESFIGCSSLKDIRLSESLTMLENHLFIGCKNLESIKLPNNLNKIGMNVFENCFKLNNISFPTSLNTIGPNPFINCYNLNNITLNNNTNFTYENGILYSKINNTIEFIAEEELKNKTYFVIPEGIQNFDVSISKYSNISRIVIPSTLISINISCLPSSISEIEVKQGNKNYYVEKNINVLYNANKDTLVLCYEKCENITIANNIKYIGRNAFKCSPNIKNLILPDSIESIEDYAFEGFRYNNATINMGKNVNKIGIMTEYSSSQMQFNFIIDSANPYYAVEDFILYNKDKTIVKATLKSLTGTYVLKSTVKIIDDSAFRYQRLLDEIILPNGLEKIGNLSFAWGGLKSISIPSSVNNIDRSAFNECGYLSKIILDKKKDSIANAPWGAMLGNRIVEWKE